jgi:hypothetical protein
VALVHLVGVRAEDLARRELDHALDGRPRGVRGLEHVVRADQVDAHRPDRALEDGVDARDRRAVDDVRRAGGELAQEVGVEHVAAVEGEARVLGELGAGERVAVEVVERDHVVRVDEPPRERRADEAGPARDQDPLALQRHRASLAA